jgi:predicted amino acid-binding ACT domain protein
MLKRNAIVLLVVMMIFSLSLGSFATVDSSSSVPAKKVVVNSPFDSTFGDASFRMETWMKAVSAVKLNRSADLKKVAVLLKDILANDYPNIATMSSSKIRKSLIVLFKKYLDVNVISTSTKTMKTLIQTELQVAAKAEQDAQWLKELQDRAKTLGVDITGLTNDEAFKKISEANDAANWAGLRSAALDYGVDITGLSYEQAEAKLREARALDQGVDISGLSPQDAEALLQATKNNQMTYEGIILQNACGVLGLNTNGTVAVSKALVSAKLGINLNGLSVEAELKLIVAALDKLGLKLP